MIETKTKKKLMWVAGLIGVFVMLVASNAQAQVKVGDNPTTVDARSVLELESTSQALYLPRLSDAQVAAQSGWKEGMMVYNTDDDCIKIYDGTAWECVGSDLNGVYSGSGDLTSTVDVKQGSNDMTFTNTGGDFKVDTTTLIVDAENNRVSLGYVHSAGAFSTHPPSELLDVQGNINVVSRNNSGIVSGNQYGIKFKERHHSSGFNQNSDRIIAGIDVLTEASLSTTLGIGGSMIFSTGGENNGSSTYGEKMRLSQGGNLGVGSTDPSKKLEVNGQIRIGDDAAGTHYDLPSTRGTNNQVLTTDGSGGVTWQPAPDVDVVTVTNITAAYTVVAADHAIFNTSTAGSTVAITLPDPASHTGRIIKIINTNSTAGGTVTFAGSHLPQGTITQLNPQASGSVISNGTNWYWYSSF